MPVLPGAVRKAPLMPHHAAMCYTAFVPEVISRFRLAFGRGPGFAAPQRAAQGQQLLDLGRNAKSLRAGVEGRLNRLKNETRSVLQDINCTTRTSGVVRKPDLKTRLKSGVVAAGLRSGTMAKPNVAWNRIAAAAPAEREPRSSVSQHTT